MGCKSGTFKILMFLLGAAVLQSCTNAVPNISALKLNLSSESSGGEITVTSVKASPLSGSYTISQTVDIQVTFSEAVYLPTATGVKTDFPSVVPSLKLETGVTDHSATYISGNGTATLLFRYTVQLGDSSSDLGYVDKDSFELNTGTIKGLAEKTVNKTLPVAADATSLSSTSSVSISGHPQYLSITAGAAFIDTVVGFKRIQTVSLNNTSSSSITLSTMSFSNSTVFEFVGGGSFPGTGVVSPACGTTLAAGASCNLKVAFTPNVVSSSLSSNLDIVLSVSGVSINNSLTVNGIGVSSLNLSVSDGYSGYGSFWNKYVKNDGSTVYNASSVACAGNETGDYFSSCIHAAEIKSVQVAALQGASCSNLSITDSLNVFDWICDETNAAVTGFLTFYSTSLKSTMGLKDLIATSGTTGLWKGNAIQVQVTSGPHMGLTYGTSAASQWWSNTIIPLTLSTSASTVVDLAIPYAVYVITADQDTKGGYQITEDGVSVVALNNSILHQTGSTYSANCNNSALATPLDVRGVFCGFQRKFLWFEVNVDGGYGVAGVGNYAASGIILNETVSSRVQFSKFQNFKLATAAYAGVRLINSSRNLFSQVSIYNANLGLSLENVAATGSPVAKSNIFKNIQIANINSNSFVTSSLKLSSAHWNRFSDIQIAGAFSNNLDANGVILSSSNDNVFQRVLISNISGNVVANTVNSSYGFRLKDSSTNVISQLTVFGVKGRGVYFESTSGITKNYLSHATIANNSANGLEMNGSAITNHLFNSIVTVNNELNLVLYASSSSLGNSFHDMVSTNSTRVSNDGVAYIDGSFGASFNNYFLIDNGSTGNRCYINVAATTNLTSTCQIGGGAQTEAAANNSANSFVGKVTVDSNTGQTSSGFSIDYSTFSTASHWLDFSYSYRGWASDGDFLSTFPHASQLGSCDTNSVANGTYCRIYDWRLRPGTFLVNRSFSHSALNSTETFSGGSCSLSQLNGNEILTLNGITFMKYAIEIDGDNIGNDNGLCESFESCVYAPNIGSFQGEGGVVAGSYCTTGSGASVVSAKIYKNFSFYAQTF